MLNVPKLRTQQQLRHRQDQHGAQRREDDRNEHVRHDVDHENAIGHEYVKKVVRLACDNKATLVLAPFLSQAGDSS